MNVRPVLSIVIPTYNNSNSIKRCLESIRTESNTQLEIICIDDGSKDDTYTILEEYARKDDRFQILKHDTNLSAHIARREGALLSRGKYVWFIDGDDTISENAIMEIISEMESNPVSILHFSTTIIKEGKVAEKRVKFMEKFVRPFEGTLIGEQIFKGCFKENKYKFSIWNKLFDGDMCRKAFASMVNKPLPKAQDKYEYLVLSLNAQSYRGTNRVGNYEYHFGAGLTGTLLDKKGFERYCTMSKVADASRDYISNIKKLEQYHEIMTQFRRELIVDCINNWTNSLTEKDRGTCFDMMINSWGTIDTVSNIANSNWYDQGKIATFVENSELLSRKPKAAKRIVTYYHSMTNGGVQRVMAGLVNIWTDMGYEVLIITDTEKTKNDYPLKHKVKRVVIPAANQTSRDNYSKRAEALQQAIQDFKPDVMVYHAWVTNLILWDMMICKLNGVQFISHCHNNFSILERNSRSYFASLPRIYRLCDGVIALSEMDELFWKGFNPNVHQVINPLTFNVAYTKKNSLNNNTIIWLARLSPEKRPKDAIRIMNLVVQSIPDAKLIIVGSGSESIEHEMKKLIQDLSLNDNIIMKGFTLDVLSEYSMASLFLMTSEYEGFPTTLSESQSLGLPCVMYDMPYLTLVKNNPGVTTVRQGDQTAAADAIINLLNNREKLEYSGTKAFEKMKELNDYDFEVLWKTIFKSLEKNYPNIPKDDRYLLWETLLDSYEAGTSRSNSKINDLEKRVKEEGNIEDVSALIQSEVDKAVAEVKNSWTYKFGEIITLIPKILRGDIKL